MGKRRINKQEISSDDEVNENVSVSGSESSAQDTETPAQKRLRLTKQYLAGIKGEEELQRDLLKSQGKWFAKMADNFQDFEFQVLRKIKTRSPCVAFVMFNDTCYYADQHGVYSFVDGEKQVLLAQNHTYAMDISFDGKYLVSQHFITTEFL